MWVKAVAEGSPGCVESETQGPRGSFVFTPVEERHVRPRRARSLF